MSSPPPIYVSSLSFSAGYVREFVAFLPYFVRVLILVVLGIAVVGLALRISAILRGEGTIADYIGIVLVAVLLLIVAQIGLMGFVKGF